MHTTARNVALQLGALISLYLSLTFLLVLLFGVITLAVPAAVDRAWEIESAASQVRFGFAMVVVFFPALVILTRFVNQIRRSETDGTYHTLTRWLIYLSLLVAGLTLLGDLVSVVYAFLEGDLTTRFILKALTVFVVIGAAFTYYLLDARSYWTEHEGRSVAFAAAATFLVCAALGAGVYHIEPPAEVREQKIDAQQVSDLQQIEWQITNYLREQDELPDSLEAAFPDGMDIPTAPAARAPYEYRQVTHGFELCATFTTASKPGEYGSPRPVAPSLDREPLIENAGNFSHGTGRVCFGRTVTPSSSSEGAIPRS